MGELFAGSCSSLAGERGAGVGEQGVTGGVPAGSGVGEQVDHEGGLLSVVGGDGAGLGAAPDDAAVTQDAEGDRVAAAFGEEVSAEAEHVCPAAQRAPVWVSAEGPAGVDEPFYVGALGVCVEVDDIEVQAAAGVTGGFGALGGVLGQVPGGFQIVGSVSVGDFAVAGDADRWAAEFLAPADAPAARLSGVRLGGECDGGGSV